MQLSPVEVFGYLASAVIAYSLTRSSIVKLRWFNLFGASSFCAYGIIIGAYPVALLNGFIAITNVFFLRKLTTQPDKHFRMIEVNRPSNYVDFFIDSHRKEIQHLFPRFLKTADSPERKYILMTEYTDVIGVLSGVVDEDGTFVVDFDFVVAAYRDCGVGHYILGRGQALQKQFGFDKVGAKADSMEHEHYLSQIGFSPKQQGIWTYQNQ